MERSTNASIIWAILAAALYALSAPFSKLLMAHVSPYTMAALLIFREMPGPAFLIALMIMVFDAWLAA